MNKIVQFRTAYKLKQLGFNIPVQNRYLKEGILNKNGELRYGDPIDYNNDCFQDEGRNYTSAPTGEEVLYFLLEGHNISVEVYFYKNKWFFDIWDVETDLSFVPTVLEEGCETYKEALEKALNRTLDKLLNK